MQCQRVRNGRSIGPNRRTGGKGKRLQLLVAPVNLDSMEATDMSTPSMWGNIPTAKGGWMCAGSLIRRTAKFQ